MPEAKVEVKFVKHCRIDQQSIPKMQRLQYKLDVNDANILKSAMLTDKHTQMAQELLH